MKTYQYFADKSINLNCIVQLLWANKIVCGAEKGFQGAVILQLLVCILQLYPYKREDKNNINSIS